MWTFILQDFEAELRKCLEFEQAVAEIEAEHAVGPLLLDTAPLKASLKAEAAAWKSTFAKNLHNKGAEDLKVFLLLLLLYPRRFEFA